MDIWNLNITDAIKGFKLHFSVFYCIVLHILNCLIRYV